MTLTRERIVADLEAAGLQLPTTPPLAAGAYAIVRKGHGIAQTSALGPFALDGKGGFSHVGEVGSDLNESQARSAAVVTGLNLVAAIASELRLGSIVCLIEVVAYIRASTGFVEHAQVADGVSSALLAGFGPEIGEHARTVVGVCTLPFDLPLVASVALQIEESE